MVLKIFMYTIPLPTTFLVKLQKFNLISTLQEQCKPSTSHATGLLLKCFNLIPTMLQNFHTFTYYLLLLILLNSSCDMDLAFSISMFCLFSFPA